MKKMALLIIALAFALTGCASMEGEKETSPIPTETIVSTDNAPAQTTETDNGTAENVAGIFDVLNRLEYQPYTCDGLPEYLLTAADGTVYSINFSEKWIWRGNSEQAELSDELIARLKEDKNLMQTENVPVETNKPKESKRTVESISTLFEENGYYTKCENTENYILSGEQYVLFLVIVKKTGPGLSQAKIATKYGASKVCVPQDMGLYERRSKFLNYTLVLR